nr:TGS domain-containing protein [Bacilli bacterium]
PKVEDCYATCDLISSMYKVIESKNKDYITNPKTNRYMGLHRSIITADGTLIQFQFKTPEMYKINQNGITEYWEHLRNQGKTTASQEMQDEVKKMQFYQFLDRIGKENLSFREYSDEIRSDILSKMIYVENGDNKVIELPEKSTILDYAFRTSPDNAQFITGATVNGEPVGLGYVLDNKNVVNLSYGTTPIDLMTAGDYCHTHYARRKIGDLKQ